MNHIKKSEIRIFSQIRVGLIFEHTHEELVDQGIWDIVQEVRSHKRRQTNMDEQNIFSGLVYCADCGKPVVLYRVHTMKP